MSSALARFEAEVLHECGHTHTHSWRTYPHRLEGIRARAEGRNCPRCVAERQARRSRLKAEEVKARREKEREAAKRAVLADWQLVALDALKSGKPDLAFEVARSSLARGCRPPENWRMRWSGSDLERVVLRGQADLLASWVDDPSQLGAGLSHIASTTAAMAAVRSDFLAVTGRSRLPAGAKDAVRAQAELAIAAAREAWAADEPARRARYLAEEEERRRLDAPRKRVEVAFRRHYGPLLSARTYRRSTSRWAGGRHIVEVEVGEIVGCDGHSTRAWSGNGKWSGTNSIHRFVLPADWPEAVEAEGLAVVGGRVVLDARPVKGRLDVWEATRAVPGRGVSIRSEKGMICRSKKGLRWCSNVGDGGGRNLPGASWLNSGSGTLANTGAGTLVAEDE